MIMVLPSSSSSSGWLTLSHPLPPPSLFGGAAAAAKTAMSRVLPRVVMCLFYDGDMTGPRCCPIRDCRLTTSHAKRTKFEEHTHSAGPSRHIYIYGVVHQVGPMLPPRGATKAAVVVVVNASKGTASAAAALRIPAPNNSPIPGRGAYRYL